MSFPRAQPAGPGEAGAGPAPTQSSLFGRSIWYVVATASQLLAAVAVSPVLAHVLGPEEFGRQALTVAVYQILILVAQVGMDQAIWVYRSRAGLQTDTRALLAGGCALAFVIGLVMLATMGFWGQSLGFRHDDPLLLAAVVWSPAGAATIMLTSYLLAEDKLAKYVVVTLTYALVGQLVGLVFVFTISRTAEGFTWGQVAAQYAALIFGVVAAKPLARGIMHWRRLWTGLQIGVPVMASQMAVYVLNSSDRVVVQRDLGSGETGRYQVAYIVGSVLILVLGYLNQSWGPRFLVIRDGAARRAMLGTTRDDLFRLLTPSVVGLTLAAPLVLRLLAPASFRPGPLLPVLFFIVVSAYPFAAAGASRRELMALGRLKALAGAAGAAAVLNIALNIVMVPSLHILGSAIATLVAFAAQAAIQRVCLGREALPRVPTNLYFGAAIAIAVAGGSVFVPQGDPWIYGRFVLSIVCLAWLVLRLRRTRLAAEPGPATKRAPRPSPRRGTSRSGRHRRPVPRPHPMPDRNAVAGRPSTTEIAVDPQVDQFAGALPDEEIRSAEGRHRENQPSAEGQGLGHRAQS